ISDVWLLQPTEGSGSEFLLTAVGVLGSFGETTFTSCQFHGAVYTSNSTGTIVDQNIYSCKADVYANGGPQNQNNEGLPDGIYYFQVTDPNGGVLLSTDNAVCRQVTVTGGVISGAY